MLALATEAHDRLPVADTNPAGAANKINRLQASRESILTSGLLRRDQIGRVADRLDCAKLTKSGSARSISVPCSCAADVDLRMSLTYSSRSVFIPVPPIMVVPAENCS